MDYFQHFGKMPVVIGVVTLILAGIIVYLARLDIKVSRLEKEMKEQNQK